ncbi:MAG: hypothetical protein AAB344_05245, partial [Bacteroidota bacterium]
QYGKVGTGQAHIPTKMNNAFCVTSVINSPSFTKCKLADDNMNVLSKRSKEYYSSKQKNISH